MTKIPLKKKLDKGWQKPMELTKTEAITRFRCTIIRLTSIWTNFSLFAGCIDKLNSVPIHIVSQCYRSKFVTNFLLSIERLMSSDHRIIVD